MTDKTRPMAMDIRAEQLPYPANHSDMAQPPDNDLSSYRAAGKRAGKVALITGGDSGVGRAVAIGVAIEGVKVAILYKENDGDAGDTAEMIAGAGAC